MNNEEMENNKDVNNDEMEIDKEENEENMEIDFDNSDSDDTERCAICLDFQNCDSIPMECCNKLIHSYCLNEWLTRKNNCPLCRTSQSSSYNNYQV